MKEREDCLRISEVCFRFRRELDLPINHRDSTPVKCVKVSPNSSWVRCRRRLLGDSGISSKCAISVAARLLWEIRHFFVSDQWRKLLLYQRLIEYRGCFGVNERLEKCVESIGVGVVDNLYLERIISTSSCWGTFLRKSIISLPRYPKCEYIQRTQP